MLLIINGLSRIGSYSNITQDIVEGVRPGLSGVGSIVFRGEEEILHGAHAAVDFYDNVSRHIKEHLRNGSF